MRPSWSRVALASAPRLAVGREPGADMPFLVLRCADKRPASRRGPRAGRGCALPGPALRWQAPRVSPWAESRARMRPSWSRVALTSAPRLAVGREPGADAPFLVPRCAGKRPASRRGPWAGSGCALTGPALRWQAPRVSPWAESRERMRPYWSALHLASAPQGTPRRHEGVSCSFDVCRAFPQKAQKAAPDSALRSPQASHFRRCPLAYNCPSSNRTASNPTMLAETTMMA